LAVPALLSAQNYLYVSSLSTDGSTIMTTYNTADRTVAASTTVRAGAITLSPDGRTVYLADANGSSVVGSAAGSAALLGGANVGAAPVGLAVTPNGNLLVVANQVSGTVNVLNARTFGVLAAVAAGFSPAAVVMHPDGEEAFIANQNGGDIAVLALTGAPRIARRLRAGASPIALSFLDGDRLLVLDAASESAIRLHRGTGETLGAFEVGPEPAAMVLSRDNRRVYVSSAADTTIRIFNAENGAAMGAIRLPDCPWPRCGVMSLALTPDGNALYAASSNTNLVHAVNLADNSVSASWAVPSGPRWIAVGPVPPRN
jgi:YVTN family beta-propeller protein